MVYLRKCNRLSSLHTLSIYLLTFLLSFLLLTLKTTSIYANNILFEDDFNSVLDDSWKQNIQSASWELIDNKLVGKASHISGGSIYYSYIYNEVENLDNYTFEGRINGFNSVDKNIMFNFNEDGGLYLINIRSHYATSDGNDVLFQKCINFHSCGAPITLGTYPFSNSVNTWYKFKIQVRSVGETEIIRLFIDDNLIFETTDTINVIKTGGIGFGLWPNNADVELYIDDIVIINDNISPTTPPSNSILLEIQSLKQTDPLWGGNEYDNANEWASNPTIARWGCALTSAVMNLRYNNHDIGVDGLNNWLKGQKDGYVRGGYLNWLAVSRYSKINDGKIDSGKDLPVLEYKSDKDISLDNIKTYLDNSIPPIIKLPGHFVISKGYSDTEILINDPSSTNTKLSDITGKWGAPARLDIFTPSHTDLSYIMFLLDPVNDLEIINLNSNQEVTTTVDELDMLTDPEDNSNINNLKPTKAVYLPKPPSGLYRVNFKGNNNLINTYLYDANGNPVIFNNTLKDGESLLIYTGDINYSSPNTPRSLEQDINYGLKTKLIKNRIAGKLLLANAEVFRKAYERRLLMVAGSYLKILQRQVDNLRAREIDANFKIYLQTKIGLLLEKI